MRWSMLLVIASPALAQPQWSLEALGGYSHNFASPTTIHQDGYPQITLSGDYDSEPFKAPIYYALRAGRRVDNRAWEIEFIHHKLYLKDDNDEVDYFALSHGHNIFFLNHAWLRDIFDVRAGIGTYLSHPESTIRGQPLDENHGINGLGYYRNGWVMQAALGKRYAFTSHWQLLLEAKLTHGQARVPVVDGHADIVNTTLHLDAGLGYRF